MAVDCVCTSCAPPRTSTASAIAPTSSVTFTERVVAASSSTSVTTEVLKPLSEIVTVYLPASSAGTSNAPAELVTATVSTLVAAFLTTTVAPGTSPAAVSTTMPASVDFALPPCANAGRHNGPANPKATSVSRREILRMPAPCRPKVGYRLPPGVGATVAYEVQRPSFVDVMDPLPALPYPLITSIDWCRARKGCIWAQA